VTRDSFGKGEAFWPALWDAVRYAAIQATLAFSLVSVAHRVKTTKETNIFGVGVRRNAFCDTDKRILRQTNVIGDNFIVACRRAHKSCPIFA
jgi:hypothetical protein